MRNTLIIMGLLLLFTVNVSATRYVDQEYVYAWTGSAIYRINKSIQTSTLASYDTIYTGTGNQYQMKLGATALDFYYWSANNLNYNLNRYNKTDDVIQNMAGLNRSYYGLTLVDNKLFTQNTTHITMLDHPDLTVNLSAELESCTGGRPMTVLNADTIVTSCTGSTKYGMEGYYLHNLSRRFAVNFSFSDSSIPTNVFSVDADASYVYATVANISETYLITSDLDGNIVDYHKLTDYGYASGGYQHKVLAIDNSIYVVGRETTTEKLRVTQFDKELNVLFNQSYGSDGLDATIGVPTSDYSSYIYIPVSGDGGIGGLYQFDYNSNYMENQVLGDMTNSFMVSHTGSLTSGQTLVDVNLKARLNGNNTNTADVLCLLYKDGVAQAVSTTNSTGDMYWENLVTGSYSARCEIDAQVTTGSVEPDYVQYKNFTLSDYSSSTLQLYIDWTDTNDPNLYTDVLFTVTNPQGERLEGVEINIFNDEELSAFAGSTMITTSTGYVTQQLVRGNTYYYEATKDGYTNNELTAGTNLFITDRAVVEVYIVMSLDGSVASDCYIDGWVTDGTNLVDNKTIQLKSKLPEDFEYNSSTRYIHGGQYNITLNKGHQIILNYPDTGEFLYSVDVDNDNCAITQNLTVQNLVTYNVFVYNNIGGVNKISTGHNIIISNYTGVFVEKVPSDILVSGSNIFTPIKLVAGESYNITAYKTGYSNGTVLHKLAQSPKDESNRNINLYLEGDLTEESGNCAVNLHLYSVNYYDTDNLDKEYSVRYRFYNAITGARTSISGELKTTDELWKDVGRTSDPIIIKCNTDYRITVKSNQYAIVEGIEGDNNIVSVSQGVKTEPVYMITKPSPEIGEQLRGFTDDFTNIFPWFFWLGAIVIGMFFLTAIWGFMREII